jgi:hypothetical protein
MHTQVQLENSSWLLAIKRAQAACSSWLLNESAWLPFVQTAAKLGLQPHMATAAAHAHTPFQH